MYGVGYLGISSSSVFLRVQTFPKSICPKVNVIAQVEFELANYDVKVQYVNHYATGVPTDRN